jgi:hypothetical protein
VKTNLLGFVIEVNAVVCVEPVRSHSTEASWSYGFYVHLAGSKVLVLQDPPSGYGYAGGPSRASYKASVEKIRDEFVQKLSP